MRLGEVASPMAYRPKPGGSRLDDQCPVRAEPTRGADWRSGLQPQWPRSDISLAMEFHIACPTFWWMLGGVCVSRTAKAVQSPSSLAQTLRPPDEPPQKDGGPFHNRFVSSGCFSRSIAGHSSRVGTRITV